MEMTSLSFVLRFVIGPIIALIITLIFADPIKEFIAPILERLGTRRKVDLTGRWVTTFNFELHDVPTQFTEVLEIKFIFGHIIGRVVSDPRNHLALRSVEDEKPLRLRGTIKDNRYITGTWYHPLRRSHYHGAFQLLLNQDGRTISGKWLGYSETQNSIEQGTWEWNLDESKPAL